MMMKRKTFLQLSAMTPFVGLHSLSNLNTSPDEISEPERKIPVIEEYDVIVCGAGPAGVSAAIEAGRNGSKTLLIETHGCLGGVWTSGLLTWILDHANKGGFMRELEDHLITRFAVSADIDTGHVLSFDPEIMKLLLEELCIEAGVEILLHTRVVASLKNEYKRLTHIITESKSGREAWKGKIFIDTTGDGDLAALSGCGFDFGRKEDGAIQPSSLLALLSGVTFEEISGFSRWAGDKGAGSKKRLLENIKQGGFTPSYLSPSIHPIRNNLFKLMGNHQYGFSSINSREITKATLQGRKEINEIVNALRSTGGVWKNLKLIATAEQIGIREGRRIHGLYTVTKDDLINGARFDDAVCHVSFGVDVHSVNKNVEKDGGSYNLGIKRKNYDIPLRSLIAKDVGGLMMAGRCISGDFIAHSSYRVTGNAVTMGQAAGRTSAFSSKHNILPNDINFKSLGI